MSASNTYNEKLLLRKVADGHEHAFRELLYRYAGLLGTYLFRLTRSRECAEEIVQDVFLKIWMSREVLAEVDNFRAYVFIVSRNQALNALRKITREKAQQRKWLIDQEQAAYQEQPAEDALPIVGLIDLAIEQLPRQQQRAWLLSRQQGLSYQQIAAQMAISKETVKKYIMYANGSITRFIQASIDTK